MKWIRVASRISADANVRQLARLAGADVYTIVGHLIALWGAMTMEAKDGDLSRTHDDDLEAWAEWTGRGCKRGAFARAVRATLCTEAGVVRAWEKYQGAAIREHEADRRRKSGPKPPPTDPEPPKVSDGIPPENPRKAGGIPSPTRTSTSTREEPSTTSHPRGSAAEVADAAVRPRLPADYRPDLDALLGRIAPPDRASWLRGMGARLDGMHGPVVAPDALGEAIRAFTANGADLRWNLFAGYLRRAVAPEPPPGAGVAVARIGPPVVRPGGYDPGERAERNAQSARTRALRAAQAVNASDRLPSAPRSA